jgi:hypothetical protein
MGNDFKEFSCGFGPGRSAHQALGALRTAVMTQYVNWQRRAETYNFLPFTHYCGLTRDGGFVVKRKTQSQRMRRELKQLRTTAAAHAHAAGRAA